MIIRVGDISLQRFLPEHTDILYELINRPDIRVGMSNSAEIPYSSHVSWVQENLIKENNVHLFLLINENQGQGAVLLKNITGNSGELGIMVGDISDKTTVLLTSKLLTGILYYAFQKMNFRYLNIRILPENRNSITIANKIGADFQGQDETYLHFILEKLKYESLSLNKSLFKRYQPSCIEA